MVIEAHYKEYYGVHLNHYSHSWGGVTYNKVLVTAFPDSNLVSTDTTKSADVSFLYPRLVTNKTYIDGTAEGHITVYNNDSGATTVTAFTVTLKKTKDVASSATALGSYTGTISSDNSVAATGYLTLPFFMTIDQGILEANEKLFFNVKFTSDGSLMCVSHANDSADIDIYIKVPFAPSG